MQLAICDDNKEYLNTIENFISDIKEIFIDYDIFECGERLTNIYRENLANYDAIFLDMEMKDLNGIDAANIIRKLDNQVIIIFVTNYTKYMQRSFECMPFRFLVKPISFNDFENVIKNIEIKLKQERKTFIFNENRNIVRLYSSDIIFFENQAHCILITTIDKIYKIYKSFKDLYCQLDQSVFFRVHKSFIVNFNYIKEIRNQDIILYNYNKVIPISRTYKKGLINEFINFKERRYLI